jgi:ketosteroid isomerase-like protein
MYAWMIGRVVRGRFAAMSRGDSKAVLKFFAEGARFRYGGRHELGGEYRSKAEIASWFARLWELFRIEFVVHDVVVAGPPWNMRFATRFTAHAVTADGRCFENHGMQYARIRLGRVREDHVYPDTQLVAEALEHVTSGKPHSTPAATAQPT